MEDLDVIKEFVIESTENLARLDQEMVEIEKRPGDAVLLASIFRTIHTIKGTCGFLGFTVLERITHQAENILSQARTGERDLTPELVSLILETVDAVRIELTSIEATTRESGSTYDDLVQKQAEAAKAAPVKAPRERAEKTEQKVEQIPVSTVTQTPAPEKHEEADEPHPITPVAAPDHPAATTAKSGSVAESTIRVDVGQLDKLMNLVGELVLTRNQILQFNAQHEDLGLSAASQRLNLITSELQESVMKTRMQPIGVVWSKLPRVVRDLAAACGKQIALDMDGAETELDKTIIEAIKDPLTHIVRNSCDHGIETPDVRARAGKPLQGKLSLRAFHEGGNVIIEVSDDGGGIDPQRVKRKAIEKGLLLPEQAERMRDSELVNLVFLPGFSTASRISNISGRGVGMDVVKTNIEKIGGAVDLTSKPGLGITVKVRIPLTLAIIPGLVVASGNERFVIPQASLIELLRFEGNEREKHIAWIQGSPVCKRRGQLLPLVFLNDVLKIGADGYHDSDVFNIIVLEAEERKFGLVVDNISDTQEIVVKPLSKHLKGVQCYAGATIMGDGKVALILDVLGVARCSAVSAESRSNASAASQEIAADLSSRKQALLLFSAGGFERLAVPLSLVARLEEFPREKLERAAGRTVVQYRDQILPLMPLAEHLGSLDSADLNDPEQVIVFADGDRRMGLVVTRILDIIEDAVTMKRMTDRQGLLGSGVVGQKITDFLDLQSVIQTAEQGWFDQKRRTLKQPTVLLTESSPFSRGLVRSTLEIAGYQVIEASTSGEAMEKLNQQDVDFLIASLDLPDGSASELLESVKNEPNLSALPVLALTPQDNGGNMPPELPDGFDDYLVKFDRDSMIRSLEKLSAALEQNANVLVNK